MSVRSGTIRDWFLSEEDAARLYAEHPRLKASPDQYCPTCGTAGFYRSADHPRVECNCEEQLQLHKHYLNAGIGMLYQRLTWEDYRGDPVALAVAREYSNNAVDFLNRGAGVLFLGEVGRGKTLLTTLILKELVKQGYSCWSTTFASMVDRFTAGWRDPEERRQFQRKVRMSDVMILDDLGREFRNQSKLSETTFDDVLRSRCQSARPTLITSNMSPEELHEGYGSGALSLLSENSLVHTFDGTDYRADANKRMRDEVRQKIIRPIV